MKKTVFALWTKADDDQRILVRIYEDGEAANEQVAIVKELLPGIADVLKVTSVDMIFSDGQPQKRKKITYPPVFETYWSDMSPEDRRKIGKPRAFKAWNPE